MMCNKLFLPGVIVFVGLFATTPAQAGKKKNKDPEPVQTACDKLKPDIVISEERRAEIKSAVRARVAMMGSGSAELETDKGSAVHRAVLEADDLARAYGVYQTCVMREADLIDAGTAQEIARSLMGLAAPAQVAPVVELPKGEPKQKPAPDTDSTPLTLPAVIKYDGRCRWGVDYVASGCVRRCVCGLHGVGHI